MLVDISKLISNGNFISHGYNPDGNIEIHYNEMLKEVEIASSSFGTGIEKFPVIKKAPFTLCFTNVENKSLKIEGRTEVMIAIPCGRCLSEVAYRFILDIHKEIDLEKFITEDIGELEDTNYMIGKSLDVDKLIFGEILVSWPMKVLCRDDCKGICKRCGNNQNLKECQCQRTEPDPRMAAIQDIFNQYKEV